MTASSAILGRDAGRHAARSFGQQGPRKRRAPPTQRHAEPRMNEVAVNRNAGNQGRSTMAIGPAPLENANLIEVARRLIRFAPISGRDGGPDYRPVNSQGQVLVSGAAGATTTRIGVGGPPWNT